MGQFLNDHGWITWILIGLVAGAIAKLIMPGKDPRMHLTILLGIGGAVIAGFLGQQLGGIARRGAASSPRSSGR